MSRHSDKRVAMTTLPVRLIVPESGHIPSTYYSSSIEVDVCQPLFGTALNLLRAWSHELFLRLHRCSTIRGQNYVWASVPIRSAFENGRCCMGRPTQARTWNNLEQRSTVTMSRDCWLRPRFPGVDFFMCVS